MCKGRGHDGQNRGTAEARALRSALVDESSRHLRSASNRRRRHRCCARWARVGYVLHALLPRARSTRPRSDQRVRLVSARADGRARTADRGEGGRSGPTSSASPWWVALAARANILERARSDPMIAPEAVVAEPVDSTRSIMRSAQQLAEDEGLAFTGTPGPGYSEGGDVHRPVAPPCDSKLGVIR